MEFGESGESNETAAFAPCDCIHGRQVRLCNELETWNAARMLGQPDVSPLQNFQTFPLRIGSLGCEMNTHHDGPRTLGKPDASPVHNSRTLVSYSTLAEFLYAALLLMKPLPSNGRQPRLRHRC